MVKENLKRKKRHDKDKYYHLAKEQGFRSRAAFKLIQINRKYDFLSKAKVCLDLCAAPGGWCQVAARHMPSDGVILGIDLLPIRPIRNVKTLVQDITTAECRALVKKELKSHTADVVLCDGAPNVGGNYEKDAFVQNEIALAALRVATQHLGPGGTFLTKVYRSQDYNALMWVFNQLFQTVQAIKPSSSRQQSAEIFVLCLKYRAPHSIDPRLLDPKSVFSELDDTGKASINIFSQQYEKQKRHRSGYEPTAGVLLFKKLSVTDFIEGEDPVQMLTDYNAIVFEDKCQPYAEHKQTTAELRTCMADLKVLGKSDFKALLKWRLKMKEYKDQLIKASAAQEGEDAMDQDDEDDKQSGEVAEPITEEMEEDEIQQEIKDLQDKMRAKKKRDKKKEREKMAKLRVRQALGMNNNAIELPEHDSIFSLKSIATEQDLEAVREGGFKELGPEDDMDEGVMLGDDVEQEEDSDSEEARAARLEEDLDESYQTYLSNRADERMKGTRAGKRKKAALTAIASARMAEDAALYDGDLGAYVKMLTGKSDKAKKCHKGEEVEDDSSSSSSDSESEEDEGEEDEDEEEEEEDGTDQEEEDDEEEGDEEQATGGRPNPLVVDPSSFLKEKGRAKAARWFSNPLFDKLGSKDQEVEDKERDEDDYDAEEIGSEAEEEKPQKAKDKKEKKKGDKKQQKDNKAGPAVGGKRKKDGRGRAAASGGDDDEDGEVDLDEVVSQMPKTDKQIRHEKRVKDKDRRERKQTKRMKMAGGDPDEMDGDDAMEVVDADPETAAAMKKKRALIQAGMGSALDADSAGDFEVVPADGSVSLPPVMDDRKYDSDNEQYDDEERASTLAIGTMMLRRSKAKQLVEASYNRFAWNDPNELPEWFIDDEEKHYRPQIPIPKALMDEMKERFKSLASKPIKKVAEARLRKKKREMQALKRAKVKAAAVISNPDMTDKEKLTAIRKAVKAKGGELSRPGKVYAVSKRNGSSSMGKKGTPKAGSKVKLVDKRMKKDMRGMQKKGKGGGGKKGKGGGGGGGKSSARAAKKGGRGGRK